MDKLFNWVKDGVIQEGLQRGETNVQHPEIRNNLYPSRLTKLQLNSEQDIVQCPAHFFANIGTGVSPSRMCEMVFVAEQCSEAMYEKTQSASYVSPLADILRTLR